MCSLTCNHKQNVTCAPPSWILQWHTSYQHKEQHRKLLTNIKSLIGWMCCYKHKALFFPPFLWPIPCFLILFLSFLSLSHNSFSTFLVAPYSPAETSLQEGQHSLSLSLPLHIFSANSVVFSVACGWNNMTLMQQAAAFCILSNITEATLRSSALAVDLVFILPACVWAK